MSEAKIIEHIEKNNIFGLVLCDIEVPEDQREYFAEMPPIFKNTQVSIDDIGETMAEYAKQHNTMSSPRRMLIGSMYGNEILLTTPLLWYLRANKVRN